MRIKKSNAQLEFERAQRNLRGRIESAKKAGYEFNDELKRLAGMKYSEVSPQKAVSIRREFARLNTEMLRRSKYVESGISKISGTRMSLKELQEERRTQERIVSQVNRQIAQANRRYMANRNFGSIQQGKLINRLAAEKDILGMELRDNFTKRMNIRPKDRKGAEYDMLKEEYDIVNERRKRGQYIINFFKSSYISISANGGIKESKNGYLLYLILTFMSGKNDIEIEEIIDWLRHNNINLFSFLFDSKTNNMDGNAIIENDLKRFAEYLRDEWGFIFDDKIKSFGYVSNPVRVVNVNTDTETSDPTDWLV